MSAKALDATKEIQPYDRTKWDEFVTEAMEQVAAASHCVAIYQVRTGTAKAGTKRLKLTEAKNLALAMKGELPMKLKQKLEICLLEVTNEEKQEKLEKLGGGDMKKAAGGTARKRARTNYTIV